MKPNDITRAIIDATVDRGCVKSRKIPSAASGSWRIWENSFQKAVLSRISIHCSRNFSEMTTAPTTPPLNTFCGTRSARV